VPKQINATEAGEGTGAEQPGEGGQAQAPAADAPTPAPRGKAKAQAADGDLAKRIAELEAQNAALLAAQAKPETVIEVNGPHNAQKWAESQFKHVTTTELVELIDAGGPDAPSEPKSSVLCKDGWYAPRPKPAKD
jgi:hypothetical protein